MKAATPSQLAEYRRECEYHLTNKLTETEKARLAVYRAQVKAAIAKIEHLRNIAIFRPEANEFTKAMWLKCKLEVMVAKQRLHMLEFEADTMDREMSAL